MEDVDRLFGLPLITWTESKGYNDEAMYLRVIHNWRCAYDARGLSDEQCSTFNKEILMYILDNLMPWNKEDALHDFSLLEVNR